MPITRSISWTDDLTRIDWDELAFGFSRMTTAMVLFEDPAKACRNGYLEPA